MSEMDLPKTIVLKKRMNKMETSIPMQRQFCMDKLKRFRCDWSPSTPSVRSISSFNLAVLHHPGRFALAVLSKDKAKICRETRRLLNPHNRMRDDDEHRINDHSGATATQDSRTIGKCHEVVSNRGFTRPINENKLSTNLS